MNRIAIETFVQPEIQRVDTASSGFFEEPKGISESLLSSQDLLHVARLVTIGELASCFAHEVFNPLMLIRGHMRFVDEGLAADHPLRVNVDVIDRASRRIEDMARRMLDFSRKRATRSESYDVAEMLADALRFVQPFMRDQDVETKVTITPGIPRIEADRPQILQAFVNLLQNAVESMLTCETRHIAISVTQEDDDIRIALTDVGTGIEAADLPRIFTPFFSTKGERGTGLGLYITRKVIEEHRGRIFVQTSPCGTTFVVALPIHH